MSPPLAFLSRRMSASSSPASSDVAARHLGQQAERGGHRLVAVDHVRADPLAAARERAREHEPDRDRLAVGQAVAARGLERVRERVAEVERRPHAGALLAGRAAMTSALICTQRVTRSPSTAGSRASTAVVCSRSSSTSPVGSVDDVAEQRVLRHLAEPASGTPRSGSVASVSVSASTPTGWWNAPTRFLPSGRFTAVLPPIAASTIASSVVGTCSTAMPRW